MINLTFPEIVYSIEENAFSNMKSIESIVIPEGIKSLGKHSFEKSNLYNVSFPSTLQ